MTTGRKTRENLLQIMVQTPQDIFVYWDIQPDYLEMARLLLQGTQSGMVLRVFRESKGRTDETASIHLYAGSYSNSIYFHNQNPYTTYYAELAFLYNDGYFTLLRSNRVISPPQVPIEGKGLTVTELQKVKVLPMIPFAYSPAELEQGRR
jgi:hypothetical protein